MGVCEARSVVGKATTINLKHYKINSVNIYQFSFETSLIKEKIKWKINY